MFKLLIFLKTFWKFSFLQGLEEAQKSELGKKSREFTEEIAKSAKVAAEAIAKQSEQLGKSTSLRAVAEVITIMHILKRSLFLLIFYYIRSEVHFD